MLDRNGFEEQFSEKERTLSTLISNLPGIAYRCLDDKHWTMEFVSDGCFELTGYPASDLVDNHRVSFAQLIHPDDKEFVRNEVQAALQEHKHFDLVYRIIIASGGEKWMWERGCCVSDGSKPRVLEGFITDITPLKKAEQSLQSREEQYRLLIDNATSCAPHWRPVESCAEQAWRNGHLM